MKRTQNSMCKSISARLCNNDSHATNEGATEQEGILVKREVGNNGNNTQVEQPMTSKRV